MEERGMFRALPRIDEDVFNFVMGPQEAEVGILKQYLDLWDKGLDEALAKVDEEMEGLREANPLLARIVYGGIEGLTDALASGLGPHFGELARAQTRLMSYFNILLVLHALDFQLRKEREKMSIPKLPCC